MTCSAQEISMILSYLVPLLLYSISIAALLYFYFAPLSHCSCSPQCNCFSKVQHSMAALWKKIIFFKKKKETYLS